MLSPPPNLSFRTVCLPTGCLAVYLNLKHSVFSSLLQALEVILLECLGLRSDPLHQSEAVCLTAAAFIKRYNIHPQPPPTTGFVMNSNKVELLFFD